MHSFILYESLFFNLTFINLSILPTILFYLIFINSFINPSFSILCSSIHSFIRKLSNQLHIFISIFFLTILYSFIYQESILFNLIFINSFIYQESILFNLIFINSFIYQESLLPILYLFIHSSFHSESISPTLYSFKRMRHNWYLVTSLRFRNNYSKSNFLGLRAKISINTNLS